MKSAFHYLLFILLARHIFSISLLFWLGKVMSIFVQGEAGEEFGYFLSLCQIAQELLCLTVCLVSHDPCLLICLILASLAARPLPAHLPDTRQRSRATPACSSA